jgi:hypothetical protein
MKDLQRRMKWWMKGPSEPDEESNEESDEIVPVILK